jgi:hypothetical protein
VGTDISGSSALLVGFADTETTATAHLAQILLALAHFSLVHLTRHQRHGTVGTDIVGSRALVVGFVDTETDTVGTGTFVSCTLDTDTSEAAQWAQIFLARALLSLALPTLKQLHTTAHLAQRLLALAHFSLVHLMRHQRHGTVGTDICGSSALVVGFVDTETDIFGTGTFVSLAHLIQTPAKRHSGHRHFWLKGSCRWLC